VHSATSYPIWLHGYNHGSLAEKVNVKIPKMGLNDDKNDEYTADIRTV
jgi:hypothetical protein